MHSRIHRRPYVLKALAFLATIALAAYAACIEPQWIEVKIHRLSEPDGKAAQPRLRIAQLSDLHLQTIGRREQLVAEQIERLQPDLIVGIAVPALAVLAFLTVRRARRHAAESEAPKPR